MKKIIYYFFAIIIVLNLHNYSANADTKEQTANQSVHIGPVDYKDGNSTHYPGKGSEGNFLHINVFPSDERKIRTAFSITDVDLINVEIDEVKNGSETVDPKRVKIKTIRKRISNPDNIITLLDANKTEDRGMLLGIVEIVGEKNESKYPVKCRGISELFDLTGGNSYVITATTRVTQEAAGFDIGSGGSKVASTTEALGLGAHMGKSDTETGEYLIYEVRSYYKPVTSAVQKPAPVLAEEKKPEQVKSAVRGQEERIVKPIMFDFDIDVPYEDQEEAIFTIAHLVLKAMEEKFEITLEGHCDNRGDEKYNDGLGNRRAQNTSDASKSAAKLISPVSKHAQIDNFFKSHVHVKSAGEAPPLFGPEKHFLDRRTDIYIGDKNITVNTLK